MNSEEARQQRDQLARWTKWARDEGTDELPVHLSTYMREEQRQRLTWLQRWFVPPFLEVGCSWGYIMAHLCPESAGCDINPRLVELAQFLAPERDIRVADARNLPYSVGAFATVVLAEVLEHLSWPDDVLQAIVEAKRVAYRQVLVTIPNPSYQASGALSFKHKWLATPEAQETLNGWLGPGIPVGPFLCYRLAV